MSSRPASMRHSFSARARRRDQRLELHRRLAFVALLEADARQRRRGVEQPAEAGGHGESARRARSFARAAPRWARRERGARPRRAGRADRASPPPCARARAPPGRRPASASASRWPTRSQSRAVERDQFAAPRRAVRPIALAVERDAEHRPAQAVLGRRPPRHGRGDAARARKAGPIASAERVEWKSG